MPPPFTSFEAAGFPPEMLREVSDLCILVAKFFRLYATMMARNSSDLARTMQQKCLLCKVLPLLEFQCRVSDSS